MNSRLLCPAVLGAVLVLASPAAAVDELAEALREVQKASRSKDPGPLADALYALRRHDSARAAKALVGAALRAPVHDLVRDAAVDALGKFSSDASADVVLAELKKARRERRLLLLEATGRLANPRAEQALLEAVEDDDPRVRCAAIAALGRRKDPGVDAKVAIERAAVDPDAGVRSAAISSLAERRDLENGLPLLLAMARERGRLFGDAWMGLRRLSGERLAPDPRSCAEWWRTMPGEEDWDFDKRPPEAPPPSIRLGALASWSRRIVFVLDLSEGMRDKPGYKVASLIPEDVKSGPKDVLARWQAIESRLDHARCHLARAIEHLPEDVHFDVVHGAESANAIFRRLVPATADNKARVTKRLDGLSAANRQDMFELLRLGLSLPENEPTAPKAYREGADTIVYIGTALPTWGEETDTRRIVSTLRRWTRVRQVTFQGLGVGNHGADLLADLAGLTPRGNNSSIP
ncbi:MAG: HEAT repeat domain-containing protein [Planctomycetota bacterium]|jgi:hypothetical protein